MLDVIYGFLGFKVPTRRPLGRPESPQPATRDDGDSPTGGTDDDQTTAGPAETEKKRRFTLPSAYTILFALIVLMAIATWIIPAGAYELDKEGAPVPGHLPRGGRRTRSGSWSTR